MSATLVQYQPHTDRTVRGIARMTGGSARRSTAGAFEIVRTLGISCVLLTGCSGGGADSPAALSSEVDPFSASDCDPTPGVQQLGCFPVLTPGARTVHRVSRSSPPRLAVARDAAASVAREASGLDPAADANQAQSTASSPAATALFPYFEKVNGSLDYMGVKVERADKSLRLWAPGSPSQEFPGGWVTPGDYIVSINTPRIHHQDDGTLSGTLRDSAAGFDPEHQLLAVIVNQPLEWEGWENHGLDDPPEFIPVEWGASRKISLSAGDVLHVAYGNEIVPFQKREGSDGIVIYCVEESPEYRGGLWGTGRLRWSEKMWNKLRRRTFTVAQTFQANTSTFYYGPPDGTLPVVLPADYQMSQGANDNDQSGVLARWILHRGMGYLKEGSAWSGSVDDLEQLFQFYCSNIQTTFAFSDRSAQHNHYAHGTNRYPPYQIRDFERVFVGAVALGYDPGYEPLYRLLTHLAQRAEMSLTASNSYTYNNHVVEGGLSAHRDDNAYTQWLWYTMGATDMGAKGSHNTRVWGPCFWARELFMLPHSSATESMLWTTGPRFGGSPNGHAWTADGIGPGYNTGYGSLEIQGAMWLWFTDTCTDSQLSRWARRDYLYTTNVSGSTTDKAHYGPWVQATFVNEPLDLQVTGQDDDALLTWSSVSDPDLSHYKVYCRDAEHGSLRLLDTASTTTFLHENLVAGETVYYQVSAVDADGNEGSLSDQEAFSR